MKKFTIISDPGIDDIIALALLNKLSPASHSVVSTFGNASIGKTTRNVKEFISFVTPSWKFKKGSALAFNKVLERPWPNYFHGKDGLWGVHPQISIAKIKELKTYPKNTDVISLGPMTNVLDVANKKLNTIMIMGGAFRVSGNETAFAEANIAYDPDAASKFFKICKNIDVKVVPLDITRKVFWTEKKIQAIPETNKVNIWLKKLLITWFTNYSHEKEKDFNLHDPLAVFLTFFPKKAKWKRSGVQVITQGKKRGQTVVLKTAPPCSIGLDIGQPGKIAEEIYDILFSTVSLRIINKP